MCLTGVKTQGLKEISDLDLLLPVSPCTDLNMCRPARHKLYASNGCYTWENSHPNIIQMILENEYDDCNNYVTLVPLLNYESNTLIWITARDRNSGQVLGCQAKIGLISKLAININYHHFYINDKKHVEVVAYDDKGSIFSGLDGFRFDWTIPTGSQNIKLIQKPEGYNFKSGTDVAFFKGLREGTADVNVKLIESGYEFISSVQVQIFVFDPFVIEPHNFIYLLPTCTFRYSLEKLKKQDNGEIIRELIQTQNNKQYRWSASNSTVGSVNQSGMYVSRMHEGTDIILVVDQNMVNNTAQTQVQVVYPYKITMSIHDVTFKTRGNQLSLAEAYNISLFKQSESYILVEERTYLILLSVYDKYDHKVTLTDNLVFESYHLLDNKWIQKIETNKIGSEILFKTNKIDDKISKMQTTYKFKQIKNQANEVFDLRNNAKLTIDVELVLTKPVKIIHAADFIHLPYIENIGQIWKTNAEGGSGAYEWSVEHPEIISFQDLEIQSLQVGITKLIVKDAKNLKNIGKITVEVSSVRSLFWLQEQIELGKNQNQSGTLNLIAVDRFNRKFTNCSSLIVQYDQKDEQRIQIPHQYDQNYTKLQEYVNEKENKQILILKQLFEENKDILYVSDLPNTRKMSEELILHNNFGICNQIQVSAKNEGLGIVLASIPGSQVESNFAEIAVFEPLKTVEPEISNYYNDLKSKNENGQEFYTIQQYFSKNITLNYGTEITWSVTGGTNYWQDFQGKYITNFNVVSQDQSSNIKVLQILTETEKTTKFDINIKCLLNQDLNQINKLVVNMSQTFKQSRLLLDPKLHQISINVVCGAPQSMKLLWSQQNDKIVSYLPSAKIKLNERLHYVKVNSNHTVKTLLFDNDKFSYLNSSSIISRVISNDTQLVTTQFPESKLNDAVKNQNYNKRLVQFSDQTGFVEIKGEVSYYVNSLLQIGGSSSIFKNPHKDTSEWNLGDVTPFTRLHDSLIVQIVRSVQVEPKQKTLYIGTKDWFKLTISEGSGHFAVTTNNQRLAEILFKDNEILIKPKYTGILEINIEDLYFVGQESTKAVILISDIDKLHLWAPRYLIEEGEDMNLIVSAIDKEGQEFDVDQYKDMKFEIITEMTAVNRELGLKTAATIDNTQFNAKGISPGIYQLTAYYKRTQIQNVASEMIQLEVFSRLEIYPSDLLITPSMRYTLQIVGGPSPSALLSQEGNTIRIQFKIEDEQIATIDQYREVIGKMVGDTVLKCQINQTRTHRTFTPRGVNAKDYDNYEISIKRIKIRVRLVTGIEIPLTNQRLIYKESIVKMNAVLKFGKENFIHGIAPISYSWNSSNTRIVTIQYPKDSSQLIQKKRKIRNNEINDDSTQFITIFNSSTIQTTAVKDGEAKIRVQLAIEYPKIYFQVKNWFEIETTILVTTQLKIQIKEYNQQGYQNTHMYLLPPNTLGFITTNFETKLRLGYSLVSVYDHSTNSTKNEETKNPIVKIVDNKAVKTNDKYGKVTVIVEQGGNQFSDQVALLNVFIEDIYSLQVMDTYPTIILPLNSEIKLPIQYQNRHAIRFADNIEGINIGFNLSHPRVLRAKIDSFSQELTIKTQLAGECNIHIYLIDNPFIYDVFKVIVSSIVRPLSPVSLHLGGEVNFKSINPDDVNAFEDNGQHPNWRSSDQQVLQIDQNSGHAVGAEVGISDVSLLNNLNSVSNVNVRKVVHGQVDQASNLVLNTDLSGVQMNQGPPEQLRVRIKLYLTKDGEEILPIVQHNGITLIKQNIGLQCRSDQPDYVQAESIVSEVEGYFCKLKYNQNSDRQKMPRVVKITVNASSQLPKQAKPLYDDQVTSFEVQLFSPIKIEKKFVQGVKLSKSQRQLNVFVFSSSDFKVDIKVHLNNGNDHQDYLKYFVQRQDINSNTYILTLIADFEVKTDFKATVELTNPQTETKTLLPVTYDYKADVPPPKVDRQINGKTPEFDGMKVFSQISYKTYSVFTIAFIFIACISYYCYGFEKNGQPARNRNNDNNMNNQNLVSQQSSIQNNSVRQLSSNQNTVRQLPVNGVLRKYQGNLRNVSGNQSRNSANQNQQSVPQVNQSEPHLDNISNGRNGSFFANS